MSDAAPPDKATLADWLAVAAGTLGALMALVDISIVNAALPTIQGEIGATPSEGTWIGTAYLVAEIVVIPLTAWLVRLIGLRRLLFAGAGLFTLFSVLCGFASSLEMMIIGRIGQGLTGGVLIPASFTIVAQRLPSRQQPLGIAIVATTALLGPAIGPVLGGWLTEAISWHYAFFINVPVCLAQIVMVLVAFRREPGDWSALRSADWLGIVGLVLGLGAMTTLLEEGHREQWFDSALIWQLAAVTVVGFALVALGQVRAERPVLRLSLLRNRSLASAIVLIAVVGMLLYTCLFIIPQFLAYVAGYNALQAGKVAFVSGVIAVPVAFSYPLLAARFSPRTIIATGMLTVSAGAIVAGRLTADSVGSDLVLPQLLYGIGTTLAAIPLQQMAIDAVAFDDVPEANSLLSVSRNIGGSIGLAAVASLQDQRLDLHHWQLGTTLAANDPAVQQRLAETAAQLGGGPEGLAAAYRAIDGEILLQSLVMTFNDMFLVLGLIGVAVVPLVLLLRPAVDRKAVMAMAH